MGLRTDGLQPGGLRNATELNAVPDKLDHRWRLDEGEGTTLDDSIGAQSLTVDGASWVSSGDATGGYYLDFNGFGDYVYSDTTVGVNNVKATLLYWVYWTDHQDFGRFHDTPNGSNSASATANDDDGHLTEFDGSTDTSNVKLCSGGSSVATSISPTGGAWRMLAFSLDGNNVTAYVYDSNEQVTANSGSAGRSYSDSYLLMMAGDTNYVGGRLDDIALSTSTAMTEAQIEKFWNATKR